MVRRVARHSTCLQSTRAASVPRSGLFEAGVGAVTQFHLYTIEWEPDQIRWNVDRETDPSPVHTASITAATMEEFHRPFVRVDDVRVWQRQ
jgi:beta-glucanase (GH16 family)